MPPRTARNMIVVLGLFGHLTLPGGLSGQDDVVPAGAAAFAVLEGAWDGTGTLFGRPATFRMRWEAAGDGFMHLAFSNGLVAEGGEVTPVLTSRAVYPWTARPPSASGWTAVLGGSCSRPHSPIRAS